MTAQKPRVYVMERQSFNLTPPPRLFLTEVRREEKSMQIFLYKRTVLLEMPVALQWEDSEHHHPARKKHTYNTHSRNWDRQARKQKAGITTARYERDYTKWKLRLTEFDLVKQRRVYRNRRTLWTYNVLFCWGYHCSSLCIGCILPWLLMLCRSTLLSSQWWTNRQWFSSWKSAVFHCFHVSSVCLPAARLLQVRHMQFILEYIFYERLVEVSFFVHHNKKKKKNTLIAKSDWRERESEFCHVNENA